MEAVIRARHPDMTERTIRTHMFHTAMVNGLDPKHAGDAVLRAASKRNHKA